MRSRLARIAILDTVCLLGFPAATHAQQTATTGVPCSSSSRAGNGQTSGAEISIAEVTFSGFLQMPISDQDQIAASVKQQHYGNSLDGVLEDALERVRRGWQDRGYFKVRISGDAKRLTSSPDGQRIAFSFHVDEGSQYSLAEISFQNNSAIRDVGALRGLFPLKDGDIFSREKIATGLDNLREAYGELGYTNFTAIPNTSIDDDKKLISLDIDVDEGKQFHVSGVNILGLDEYSQGQLLKEFPMKRGAVYNLKLFNLFLLQNRSRFSPLTAIDRSTLDEKVGTITFTLDFLPCSD